MNSLHARPAKPVTVIDVLENFLGELSADSVAALEPAKFEGLAEAVNDFYDAWESPLLGAEDLRLYSGGWIAGNFDGEDARQYLYTSLLYAPSVVVHDPVAEWFLRTNDLPRSPAPIRAAHGGMQILGTEPDLLRVRGGYYALRDDPERSRDFLSGAVLALAELAPLIREGIVVPVPQWLVVRQREDAIFAALRRDVRDGGLAALISGAAEPPPGSDQVRGGEVTPSGGVAPADALRAVVQNPAYFLSKTLAIADATSSRYIPPAAIDAALLEHRIEQLGEEVRRQDIDLQVVSALAAAELPFLGSLGPAKIIAIRRDEAAFADWRVELRNTVRLIESSPSQGDAFDKEARDVIADGLMPKVREVEGAVSRSGAMKAAAIGQAVTFGIGAAAMTGAAVVAGTPVAPAALAGLGISAVGRWVYSSLFGRSPSGTQGILATLIKKS